MKLSIQLDLSVLSLPNTVLFFELFGVDRARSTVHNWVHKSNLKLETGWSRNYVAVGGTVIQLDDEQYWLCAAADVNSNDLLHKRLEPTK